MGSRVRRSRHRLQRRDRRDRRAAAGLDTAAAADRRVDRSGDEPADTDSPPVRDQRSGEDRSAEDRSGEDRIAISDGDYDAAAEQDVRGAGGPGREHAIEPGRDHRAGRKRIRGAFADRVAKRSSVDGTLTVTDRDTDPVRVSDAEREPVSVLDAVGDSFAVRLDRPNRVPLAKRVGLREPEREPLAFSVRVSESVSVDLA